VKLRARVVRGFGQHVNRIFFVAVFLQLYMLGINVCTCMEKMRSAMSALVEGTPPSAHMIIKFISHPDPCPPFHPLSCH